LKISYIKKTKKELEIEVDGEGHTLFNPIRKILFEDKSVVFAGYHIEHPMIGRTRFLIRTDGTKTAKEAFIDAIDSLKDKIKDLREDFLEIKTD